MKSLINIYTNKAMSHRDKTLNYYKHVQAVWYNDWRMWIVKTWGTVQFLNKQPRGSYLHPCTRCKLAASLIEGTRLFMKEQSNLFLRYVLKNKSNLI